MGCGSSKSKPASGKPAGADQDVQNFINESKKDPTEDYQFGNVLGEGTYGVVIKC